MLGWEDGFLKKNKSAVGVFWFFPIFVFFPIFPFLVGVFSHFCLLENPPIFFPFLVGIFKTMENLNGGSEGLMPRGWNPGLSQSLELFPFQMTMAHGLMGSTNQLLG